MRKKCALPDDLTYKMENQIASKMIQRVIDSGNFSVRWIGCDAAFGCDYSFLRILPNGVHYFAAIRENERVFQERPEMVLPSGKAGRPPKYPRPSAPPVTVKDIVADPYVPWERRTLAQGAKCPICADVKCIRCVSSDSSAETGNYVVPMEDVWLYIRKYEDGST